MKRARPERSRSTDQSDSPWDDAYGIALLMVAAMFFLALMSYDPGDLPGWAHLVLSDETNAVTHNFIGQVGAIVAGYSLFLMGLGAYILPISLTWLGVCKLASGMKITRVTWLGVVLLLISGTALMTVNHLFEWEDGHLPHGGGGGLGRLVGETLFGALLGRVGATLMLGMVYLMGFFMVTNIHPVRLLEELKVEVRSWLERWRVRREMAAAAKMVEEPVEAAVPVKARRKRKVDEGEVTEEAPIPALPLSNMELPLKFAPPAPKIIDSSERRQHGADGDKPKLAEVWGKKRAQKIEQAPHGSLGNLTVRFKNYELPELELLNWPEEDVKPADKGELLAIQATIVRTLSSFGITVEPGDITRGPSITRYEVRPADGLRVSRIANLDADLARATRAERINILAPIPGKDTVGIEVANKDKVIVPIRELLEDDIFQNGKAKLPIALGKDVYGKTIIGDLAAMPHLLVAGATGSGKSVCINGIVTSLLCRFAPDELRFILIDPKVVEMQNYAELPHLALPVVTDPKKALLALRWVVKEMENRYQIFAQEACRNFETFNSRNRRKAEKVEADKLKAGKNGKAPAKKMAEVVIEAKDERDDPRVALAFAGLDSELGFPPDEDGDVARVGHDWSSDATPPPPRKQELVIPDTLPYIVVIIDELADLMQTAPADIEGAIARITQMARAAGIHLIVATQTPRADVITGVIKANIPTRIAFQVASALDSRVILDRKGAENLVGKGDMLYVPPGGAQPIRSQGALVTDEEIHSVVQRCVDQGKPIFDVPVNEITGDFEGEGGGEAMDDEEESLLEDCLEVIRQEKKASTSLLQRRLRLGYGRAARMIDILEDRGIIGPQEGAKPREILVHMD